jgi:phosphoribosylaminoimidazolecarboxamide formyltransferase/IMP cyclohydrolase
LCGGKRGGMRALISVYDKSGILEFATGLKELDVQIVATDGTYEFLKANGIEVEPLSSMTGEADILSGNSTALHPVVFAAILADRSSGEHNAALDERGIVPIDIVVVNLYPFSEVVSRPDGETRPLDYIDVGDAALLRAAGKNYQDVTVVVDPDDYEDVLAELYRYRANKQKTRLRLAAKAFAWSSAYDAYITSYFAGLSGDQFPDAFAVPLYKIQDLRYGENLHQQGALYTQTPPSHEFSAPRSVAAAEQLQGKELSFNNWLDVDAAWSLAHDFAAPAVAIVKQGNVTGVAAGSDIKDAFEKAFQGDPAASYGGIVGMNRPLDAATAEEIVKVWFEAVVTPDVRPDAGQVLQRKKAIRLLSLARPGETRATQDTTWIPYAAMDFKRIDGGFLLQTANRANESTAGWQVVSQRQPTLEELTDLQFAWRAVKHVKSNAIVLAKKLSLVGVGAGQMSRANAVDLACRMAEDRTRGSVLASDAYFSFTDGVERAIEAGVTAIVQPGGSIRDRDVIETVDHMGVAMIFTGLRHFRH